MASLTPDEKDVLEANERFYESLSAGVRFDGISAACAISILSSARCEALGQHHRCGQRAQHFLV